jgi:hypothetical protein
VAWSFFFLNTTTPAKLAVVSILLHITCTYQTFFTQHRIRSEIERASAIDPRNPCGISDLGFTGTGSEEGPGVGDRVEAVDGGFADVEGKGRVDGGNELGSTVDGEGSLVRMTMSSR